MDSIFAQTYNNLEIILVNDGSTDRSDEFCKKYANTDNRVVYVSHENRGVSAARNTGLDHATGNYILFIDADDYVENNLVENIVKIFRESVKELDMVTFGTSRVDINRKISSITWDSRFTTEQILTRMLYISGWTVTGKAYHKRIWENIRFNDSIKTAEDIYISPNIASKIKSARALDHIYYYWEKHPHRSLTQTANSCSFYQEYLAWKHHLDYSISDPDMLAMINVLEAVDALKALLIDQKDHKLNKLQRTELTTFLKEEGYEKDQLSPLLLSYLAYRQRLLTKIITEKSIASLRGFKSVSAEPKAPSEEKIMKYALKVYAANSVNNHLSDTHKSDLYTYIHDMNNLPLRHVYKLLRHAILQENRFLTNIVGHFILGRLPR